MGRKIEIKKIQDMTKCQVTFSKRRSSLVKKANEIAVCCDVDVALVAFSPSGRVTKFSNRKRMEEVLRRYADLPAELRCDHVSNLQGKIQKLRQLGHFSSDTSKLHFLDKQIENLELQIKKSGLELQILEANLRDYELISGQELSLHALSWCERNLNRSLEKVMATKAASVASGCSKSSKQLHAQANDMNSLDNQSVHWFSSDLNGNSHVPTAPNPTSGQLLMMQLDPWISPYNARVRENLFHNIVDQGNYANEAIFHNLLHQGNSMPYQDQRPLNHLNMFPNSSDQQNYAPVSISPESLMPGIFLAPGGHRPSPIPCDIQGGPRFTLMTPVTSKACSESSYGLQIPYSNLNQFPNMEGLHEITINDQYHVNPPQEASQVPQVQSLQPEVNLQFISETRVCCEYQATHDSIWESKTGSNSWEWDDLLLQGNFNVDSIG